jgi:hypothetical protein
MPRIKTAAVQAAPVVLDREGTLPKPVPWPPRPPHKMRVW